MKHEKLTSVSGPETLTKRPQVSSFPDKKESSVLPWHFRLLASVIRCTSIVMPQKTAQWTSEMWFRPFAAKVPAHVDEWWATADKQESILGCVVSVWGQRGPLVVATHGWRGSGWQFRRFVKPLVNAGYRVALFDGPAHGKHPKKYTHIYEFVDVLREINQKVGPIDTLLGHSLGCVAIGLSPQYEVRPRKVIFIAGNFDIEFLLLRFCQHLRLSPDLRSRVRSAIQEYCDQQIFAGAYDTVNHSNVFQYLRNSEVGFWQDESDSEVDSEVLRQMSEELSGRYSLVDNVGHFAILKSQHVVAEIVEFIGDPENANS